MADNKKPNLDAEPENISDQKEDALVSGVALEEALQGVSPEPRSGDVLDQDKSEQDEAPDTTPDAASLDESPVPIVKSPTPEMPESAKKGGFAPALIGGALAACLGFIAARSEVLDGFLPDALKSGGTSEAVAALQATDIKQTKDLAALRAEFDALEQPDLGPFMTQLSAIQAEISPLRVDSKALGDRLSGFQTDLGPLSARLEVLEKRPMTEAVSDTAIAAYEREMTALKEAIATQRADVEEMINEARATEASARALEADAVTAATNATNQATVTRLRAALDGGTPIAPILTELASAGIPVSDDLTALAKDGVATQAALIDAFPVAARAALSAARAEGAADDGLGGFMQRLLGARSVAPREGTDPDAILSRAEAAMIDGQIFVALAEIDNLPAPAGAAMAGWVAMATTRQTALQSTDTLAQSLNTN